MNETTAIDQMRLSYTLSGLTEKELDSDPLVQFQQWFAQANAPGKPDWLESNAMTLATADSHGRVTNRVVLLKGVEQERFLFFTNYRSEKGRQIEENPQVALCFQWPHLQRQVRICGTASKTSRAASVAYFQQRPLGSRLGAVLSAQSEVIPSAAELQQQWVAAQRQYVDRDDVPCPEHWGGYAVAPQSIEFWQGRENRLHDRLLYRQAGDRWQIVRLAP
jgi:pyridoxamine 5'-phosphate oxidase